MDVGAAKSLNRSEAEPPRLLRDRLAPFRDLLPAAFLCLVAGWEAQVITCAGDDSGSDAEWAAAAAVVRDDWKAGDLVVFAPEWIEPVGRRELGQLLRIDDAARADADGYAVVWELSIRGARATETRGRELERSETVGPISVRKWIGKPATVVTDFRDLLSATIEGSAARRPALSLQEVGFTPRRCVMTVPQPNKTVVIRYPTVVLGSRLVGHVGLADVFTRRDIRDPGRIDVEVDGHSVFARDVGVEDGWVRFELETEPSPASEVVVRLRAIGAAARDRRLCFSLEARK